MLPPRWEPHLAAASYSSRRGLWRCLTPRRLVTPGDENSKRKGAGTVLIRPRIQKSRWAERQLTELGTSSLQKHKFNVAQPLECLGDMEGHGQERHEASLGGDSPLRSCREWWASPEGVLPYPTPWASQASPSRKELAVGPRGQGRGCNEYSGMIWKQNQTSALVGGSHLLRLPQSPHGQAAAVGDTGQGPPARTTRRRPPSDLPVVHRQAPPAGAQISPSPPGLLGRPEPGRKEAED